MKLSFSKKLTASYLFVVVVTLAFTGLWLTPRLKQAFLSQLEKAMAAQGILVAQITNPSLAAIHTLGRELGCRITIINRDGTVLADSERSQAQIAQMENHLSRTEVQQALRLGLGEARRHSATLDQDMLYVAVPIRKTTPSPGRSRHTTGGLADRLAGTGEGNISGVVRIALPLTEVDRRIAGFQKDLLKAGGAALVVALLVAVFSVRRISQPLRELVQLAGAIGSGHRPPVSTIRARDEFGRLAQAFNDMAMRVEEKVGELSREHTQLNAILTSLVEGLVALDHQGRVLFLNPAAEKLFGVQSAEVKNRPFLEVLRHSPLNEILTRCLAEKRPVEKEVLIHAPSERVLSIHALPVDYGSGLVGVLASLHDLTELRKLENLRREFVANVSHELKTPLTSIKGYIETLLDGALEDPKHSRGFLQTIHQHAEHLGRLIDDILDLSAIEDHRVKYDFQAVSIAEVVDRIAKGLAPMAASQGVKVSLDLKANLPQVRADREKLAQIFMNLIDNAIKFNKKGGQVRISARPEGKVLQIQVEDTGMGIPSADLPRIFERFYRANKDRSHDIPGTGLGLAIVKHLVEAHQGTVEAESTLGKGTIFRFTLPLA
jgi:two-component system phosphate regulon sensor histidine kinase PhoR